MDEILPMLGERLLRWLAFALTAAAAGFALSGCGVPGAGPHTLSLPTDRTLVFKFVHRPRAGRGSDPILMSAVSGQAQMLAAAANVRDIRRLVVSVFNGQIESSGVYRQASVQLPPFSGTLVIQGIRPGRRLVKVDALSAGGVELFAGEQVVDFTPGASRFVEFELAGAPPASSGTFHGGTVSSDLRLALSQSPYTITTPIAVAAGVNLVIEGGTSLHFATGVSAAPDILVNGRLTIEPGSAPTVLDRLFGLTSGARIRLANASPSTITGAVISGCTGAAIELSGSQASITSSTFSNVGAGVAATSASPLVVGDLFSGTPAGVVLAGSSGLVQSSRFTDSSTAVAAANSSVIVLGNVVSAVNQVVLSGIVIQRSAATVSQNRLVGVTGSIDPSTGRLIRGLDKGIVVVDSVSGTGIVSSRVVIDHNTIQGANTVGIAVIDSDPTLSFNRIEDGQGGGTNGTQGITNNRIAGIYPKEPSILDNDILNNTGPAVGFLTAPEFAPVGGGVLGSPGRDGNFILGNNLIGLGFTPGVDGTAPGAVDGNFSTRTLQVFGVDAILSASSTPIASAGAPASVR